MIALTRPTPADPALVEIRPCNSHEEFRACTELQVAVWRFDAIDVVAQHVLTVAAETGGQVLGAFADGRMVGFALAFAATRAGKVYLHSHMAAVLPEYQSHGIGRQLKIAQREEALARGIDVIEWTFDPLQSRNAYFNLCRLGAISRRYIRDFYGHSSSPLHANLATDRLLAEWRLRSSRVQAHLTGEPVVVPAVVRISIPLETEQLRTRGPSRAAEIQLRVRREFLRAFEQGYVVTGFARHETEGHYLLGSFHED